MAITFDPTVESPLKFLHGVPEAVFLGVSM